MQGLTLQSDNHSRSQGLECAQPWCSHWSLKTHEIQFNEAFEETNRRGKSIALKSTHRISSSSKATKAIEESSSEEEKPYDDDDDEKDEIAHLAERISKAWIRKEKKKGKAKHSEIICFKCKEPRHLRSECPKLKKNSKKKAPKKKAMMTIWEDLDEEQKVQNLNKKKR